MTLGNQQIFMRNQALHYPAKLEKFKIIRFIYLITSNFKLPPINPKD